MQPFKPFHISFFRFLIVFLLALVLAGGFYYWLYMKAGIDTSLLSEENKETHSQNSVDMPSKLPGLESAYTPPDESTVDPKNSEEDAIDPDAKVEIKTMTNDTLMYHIIQKSGLRALDLRGASAFEAGRVRYSESYDPKKFKASDFTTKGTYLLICDSGVCDGAKEILQKLAGKKINIQVLENGFSGWVAGGYKVLKKDDKDTASPPTQTSTSTGGSEASVSGTSGTPNISATGSEGSTGN